MLKKVTFKAESDIITCGINTDSNFINSEDYISGSVIRAGFAKDIYLDCDIVERNNFIELKDENGKCSDCAKRGICEKFSEMRFSFFYKAGCIPVPFTTKVCKTNSAEHPIQDLMLENGIAVCKKCGRGLGRMEDAKGYIDKNKIKIINIDKSKNTTTHTAINYALRTAMHGSLYTIRSLPRGMMFEGYIDDRDTGMIEEGTVVYVGKYSSNGFGKLVINKVEQIKKSKDIAALIIQFTDKFGVGDRKDPNKYYVPLLFVSDAKLGFETGIPALVTEKYNELWNEKLFGENSIFTIENVYAQNKLYGGYNTANKWGQWRIEPQVITIKGSSILASFDREKIDEAVYILKEMSDNGIGFDTINGYGKINVCDELHMIGVSENAY